MKEGWEYCKLEDAVTKGSSNISLNKIKGEEGDYPVFAAKGFVQNVSFYHQDEDYLAIIKDGAGIGRVSKHPAKSSIVATMQYLIPKKGFNIDFIKYFLAGIDFEKHRNGSTIPHIYFKDYKSEIFPKLPLPEQQRIVSILDEVFSAIEGSRNNAEQNLKNAKEVFESYLQGVFENGNWETISLKMLSTKIGSGATPRGGQENYKSEGISLVRSMNVHDWEFRDKNLAFIDEKQAKELDGVTLQEDDVLLNITGASVARCCVFPKKYLPARVNQHVSIIRPKKELLDARFLNLLLTSKPYKDQLLFTGGQGATRQAITKAQIESFRISIPSLKEQQTIVRQLDALRAETKRLEAIYQKKLVYLEELKKSVLHKAFAGELKTEMKVFTEQT
jgi:type I restriction enzyme S subunit